MEFHACYRTAGFIFPPPDDQWNAGGFYEQHPELRSINRDGSPALRLAYTFPETRRYVLSILREIASFPEEGTFPAEGTCLLYIRRPPLVGYEPPLVAGFQAEFGLDPRQLAEDDPRWLRYRCGILNQFMREVRQEMDAIAREQGRTRPIQITAMLSGREEENLLHGMDVAAWATGQRSRLGYKLRPGSRRASPAWRPPATRHGASAGMIWRWGRRGDWVGRHYTLKMCSLHGAIRQAPQWNCGVLPRATDALGRAGTTHFQCVACTARCGNAEPLEAALPCA